MIRLNLWTKFSFFLFIVWLAVSSTLLFLLSTHLNVQSELAVSERAEIVLTSMQSVRNYTRDNIQPLLKDHPTAFIQESIPNFAARKVFQDFQSQNVALKDFQYKEATPNPTNLKDLADSFERDIFKKLEERHITHNDDTQELSGYRYLENQKMFYLAQPIILNDASCLECHGRPQEAPQYLLDMYGETNGFGWKLNDVVAAQMVYVPADIILERSRNNLVTVAQMLFGVFAASFIVLNLLLWRTVIKPLKILTRTAKFLSACPIQQPQKMSLQNNDSDLNKLTRRQDEPGQLARAFNFMVDILSRREQDLQLAVQQKTQSLNQEMLERQTAQDALRTYSHAMNHDLRNLVIGISNIMQSMIFRASKSQSNVRNNHCSPAPVTLDAQALSMIQQSCDRQLQLMNSLMEVESADIWQLSLNLNRVHLGELINDLSTFYTPEQFPRIKSLRTQVAPHLPFVNGDSIQLRRVYDNLITNALKYNPNGVDLCLTAIEEVDDSMVYCAVTDNGIGIDMATRQELFAIYARGNVSTSEAGYGLGLYICRKIIEVHGGEIGLENPAQGGAKFWFTLPIAIIAED